MEDEAVKHAEPVDPLYALSGTALRAYLLLLRSRKPVGVRELQRRLGLRSPSTARHHLERLVQLGLARRQGDGYVAIPPRRGLLRLYISVRGRLVPRSTALAAFLAASAATYALLPGSDPAATALLAAAAAIAAADALTLHKLLAELEGTHTRRASG